MTQNILAKSTFIDYIILGLIQNHPHSGYQIQELFKTTGLGGYRKSPGTLYPALSRLQKHNYVEKTTDAQTGKNKFQISSMGLEALKLWLVKPVEMQDITGRRDEFFVRIAFMEPLIAKEQILTFLESYRDLLKKYINQRREFNDKELHHMTQTAKLITEFSSNNNKELLKWCNRAIQEINKEIQNHKDETNT